MSVSQVVPTRAKKTVLSSPVLATIIFIFTEIMVFSSFISAFTIVKSSFTNWPPMGQPRLPIEVTAFNSLLLFASGWFFHQAYQGFVSQSKKVNSLFILALGCALGFVGIQGFEWVRLISYGLTLTSSLYGSFFYLIIGFHALHVLAAVTGLLFIYGLFKSRRLKTETLAAMRIFWFFVVAVWPVLYGLVYL